MLLTFFCLIFFVAFARTNAISCAATGSRYKNHVCTGATFCTSEWHSEYKTPNNWTLNSQGCVLTSYKKTEKAGWRHSTGYAGYTCYTNMCNTLSPPKVLPTIPPIPTSTSPPAITCLETPRPGYNGTGNCTGVSCKIQKSWADTPSNAKIVKECCELCKFFFAC